MEWDCPHCNERVRGNKCPHCGLRRPGVGKSLISAFGLIGFLLAVFLLLLVFVPQYAKHLVDQGLKADDLNAGQSFAISMERELDRFGGWGLFAALTILILIVALVPHWIRYRLAATHGNTPPNVPRR